MQRGPPPFGAIAKKLDKAEIVAEHENMVDARLSGRRPWLADRETVIAVNGKLYCWAFWKRFQAYVVG
jgi:hypothetical protein